MRTNAELDQQLDSIRSPRQLHDEDVPLSQVAGILARTNPALFSFSVFYMENLSEQLLPDVPADCEIWQYRELGHAEPRVDVMVDCHCNGDIDLMCHTAMHAIIDSSDGCRHLLVSDTPWQLPV